MLEMENKNMDGDIDFEPGLKPGDFEVESPAGHAKRMEELSKKFDLSTLAKAESKEKKESADFKDEGIRSLLDSRYDRIRINTEALDSGYYINNAEKYADFINKLNKEKEEAWLEIILLRGFLGEKAPVYEHWLEVAKENVPDLDEQHFSSRFNHLKKIYFGEGSKDYPVVDSPLNSSNEIPVEKEAKISPVSLSNVGLTKIETHQTRNRVASLVDEKTRINFFQQNTEIRKEITDNPFIAIDEEKIKGLPGLDNKYTILRSAVLSELDGKYEQVFSKLSKDKKIEMMNGQIEQSAEITIKIEKYIENNISKVDNLSDEDLYRVLCKEAFGTNDDNKIQSNNTLSQRRGFRMSIINFIEDRNSLKDYRLELLSNPKEFANKYLKKTFTGSVSIEQSPVGFIIYLDEQDYALVETGDGDPKSIKSNGVTLFSGYLPENLKGKIVLLNKGGKETHIRTQEKISNTRKHEVRHILFSAFHEQQETVFTGDTKEVLSLCETEKDFKDLSKKISESFIERAKDEIIAYFSNGEFNQDLEALAFNQYDWHIREVKRFLDYKKDISEETKKIILDGFLEDKTKSLKIINRIRFVAEGMYKQPDNNNVVQNVLTKLGFKKYDTAHQNDISEALLRNTPGVKIHRLSRYVGLTNEEIKGDRFIEGQNLQLVNQLNNLSAMPERFDGVWWDNALNILSKIERSVPVEAIPILLESIPDWSQKTWSHLFVESALSSIEKYIETHELDKEDQQKITVTVKTFLDNKNKMEKPEESHRMAESILLSGRL